ncbi:MAG: hypothetical protein IJW37_00020 [Lachnospiraceae bacterium]|nr:hypothetical protein [Lachnospiraceae bacterium]
MGKGMNKEIQKFLLMLVLVVLMAVVAVVYLYLPLVEEKNAMVEENVALNTRWIELQNMARNTEVYKAEINASKEKINEVLSRYGAGNTPEKSIVFVNRLETEVGVEISNASFSTPATLATAEIPMIQDLEDGSYNVHYSNINLLTETLSMSYSCSYDQLKTMVDFINSYKYKKNKNMEEGEPERMNIQSITIAYDNETGKLTGNLVLNLYAVTGTDRVYEAPEVEDIRLGETNIFAQ